MLLAAGGGIQAHKPSSGVKLRVTTDSSPQGMFFGTSINEQSTNSLWALDRGCPGIMWLQWKMTPSFPEIISLALMAQRIQPGRGCAGVLSAVLAAGGRPSMENTDPGAHSLKASHFPHQHQILSQFSTTAHLSFFLSHTSRALPPLH